MTTKKKLIIAFSIAGAIIVALTIALVSVLAAFTTETKSSFSVQYKAVNVNATITVDYILVPTTANDADSYRQQAYDWSASDAFYAADTATVNKYKIKNVGTVKFTDSTVQVNNANPTNINGETAAGTLGEVEMESLGRNDFIIIRYTIKNESDATISFDYSDNVDGVVAENLDVLYFVDDDWSVITWPSGSIVKDKTQTVYVKIMLYDRTQDASLNAMTSTISLSV